jgi:hypothetical protein
MGRTPADVYVTVHREDESKAQLPTNIPEERVTKFTRVASADAIGLPWRSAILHVRFATDPSVVKPSIANLSTETDEASCAGTPEVTVKPDEYASSEEFECNLAVN